MPKALAEAFVRYLAGDRGGAGPALRTSVDTLEARRNLDPGDPRVHSALGLAYALMGDPEAAVNAGRRAVDLLPYTRDAMDAGTFVMSLTQIHALLGQTEETVRELDRCLSHPGPIGTGYIERYPLFDPLRDDPAFKAVPRNHPPANP